MLNKVSKAIFGDPNEKALKIHRETVVEINALEPQVQALSDAALRAKTLEFRQRLANGATLDDLLVEAFTQLNLPLFIVGTGPELPRLKSHAGPTITFLGYQTDDSVAEFMSRARGFVCAAEEDFGIAIVEAQAAGCPVIVYGRGGALETVIDGVTGIFFPEQTTESLVEAIVQFERRHTSFCTEDLVKQARLFDEDCFKRQFVEFVQPAV